MRAIWPEIAIALLVMVAGAVTGYFMVAHNPDWFYALLDENLAGGRVPGASEAVLRQSLFGNAEQSGMAVFAAELFSNNAQVAIMAFALGFAFGIPSILLLIQNMAMMGALLWVFGSRGLMLEFAGWLSIHGTTELFAILLAGAAGLHIGRAIAFPGRLSHLQAASDAGKRAALVMMGVVLMLVVAGLLEGFGRQLVDNTPGRFATGGVMLTLWLSLFCICRTQAAMSAAVPGKRRARAGRPDRAQPRAYARDCNARRRGAAHSGRLGGIACRGADARYSHHRRHRHHHRHRHGDGAKPVLPARSGGRAGDAIPADHWYRSGLPAAQRVFSVFRTGRARRHLGQAFGGYSRRLARWRAADRRSRHRPQSAARYRAVSADDVHGGPFDYGTGRRHHALARLFVGGGLSVFSAVQPATGCAAAT